MKYFIIRSTSTGLTNVHFSFLDLYGSDAAGVWEVFGPLPAGVILLHHWTHSALREGSERPGQESSNGLRGHFLPTTEQRCIPHVWASVRLSVDNSDECRERFVGGCLRLCVRL